MIWRNPFWHTGHAVPLETGDYRERRPWEWIWKVARGTVCGKERGKTESWHVYVTRFIYENFFAY